MSSKLFHTSTSTVFGTPFSNHYNPIARFKGVSFGPLCHFPEHPEKIHKVLLMVHIQECNLYFHLSGLKVYFRQEESGAAQ